jgi:hypothetical protein
VKEINGEKLRATDGISDLKVGDELEVDNLGLTMRSDGVRVLFYKIWKDKNIQDVGIIPIDWVEMATNYSSPQPECKCDVWITGCICGAFQREMAAKR